MTKKFDFIGSVKKIKDLPEEQRHREYLKLFSGQGLRFNVMLNGIAENDWQENYTDKKFEPRINLIERLPNILVIEFDEPLTEEGMKPSEALEQTEKKIKKQGWSYIRSTHKGKSDYLWVEFSQPIPDGEAERFLKWICPKNARIDTNFSSSVRVFPVLFAYHRKHSANIEEALYVREGKKINFSKLKIPQSISGESKTENKEGYPYGSFQKGVKVLTKAEEQELLGILKDPNLFQRIKEELDKVVKREDKTKMSLFLSLCNIWIESSNTPISTIVTSESSAGKSYICKAVYSLFPDNLKDYRTKISPEAFTYWHNSSKEPDWTWEGKICYLEDIRENVINSDAFKIMCSEGSISTIVIKGKAVDIAIKGKPVILVTTAQTSPKSEILNRFNLISLDESAQQTKEITRMIAEQFVSGKHETTDPKLKEALSLLRRKKVKIPFGLELQKHLVDKFSFDSLRLRRDFGRIYSLICCSAVLHQYQREQDSEGYILATEQDYETARKCFEVIQSHTLLSLTHKLQKALDCCRELDLQEENFIIYDKDKKPTDSVTIKGFTARDLHTKYPIVNQKSWYNHLDELSERGLLSASLEKVPNAKQRVTFYRVKERSTISLPSYSNFITKDTIVTKQTKDTIVTNDSKIEENNCNNCNNCYGQECNEVLFCSICGSTKAAGDLFFDPEDSNWYCAAHINIPEGEAYES